MLMTLFSFIAGILVGVAASYVALPIWRTASTLLGGRRPYLLAAGLVAGFALVAATIYLTIGSRHSLQRPAMSAAAPIAATAATPGKDAGTGGTAGSMQDAVAGLEARLARDGGSPADWSLLAQAYELAAALVAQMAEIEVSVGFLMQIDKLVQLIESPIFIRTSPPRVCPPR